MILFLLSIVYLLLSLSMSVCVCVCVWFVLNLIEFVCPFSPLSDAAKTLCAKFVIIRFVRNDESNQRGFSIYMPYITSSYLSFFLNFLDSDNSLRFFFNYRNDRRLSFRMFCWPFLLRDCVHELKCSLVRLCAQNCHSNRL